MAIQVILNQHRGPLPITAAFNSPTDGPSCIVVSGSVWAQATNQPIGIEVTLDGKAIGSALIFSNLASTHRAVVPTYIPVTLTIGPHKLMLSAATSFTISDANDFFDAVLDF